MQRMFSNGRPSLLFSNLLEYIHTWRVSGAGTVSATTGKCHRVNTSREACPDHVEVPV